VTTSAKPTIRVVAAALYDGTGRVLIAERPPGKHMAGRWEFPGGKIATGESEAEALSRELREELGIVVGSARALMRLSHAYEDRLVELSLWVVLNYTGAPSSLDGQRLKWVPPEDLAAEDILEADRPFVDALGRLPPPFEDTGPGGTAPGSGCQKACP
jgi:8-oxo-dGTP diphosphatase